MTTTHAIEPYDGNVMFTDENGTVWHYRRSAGPDARRVFIYMHDFRAHMTARYIEHTYGPCVDSLAEMLAAMRWAESGVNYFGV